MNEELQNEGNELALKTVDLNKFYGGKKIIDSLNLSIKRGSIYALIGKNGAGKTTIMRLIFGLASPSSGSIQFLDESISKDRKKMSGVIESPALYPNLCAESNIKCQCYALGVKNPKKVCKELLDLVNLADSGKKKVKDFSLGMKQRLAIAVALVGDPSFLLLDEPINGLDPQGIREVRELILKLNKERNVTVVISSHILGELYKVATDYGVICSGKLVKEFSKEELESSAESCIRLRVNDTAKALELISTELNINNYKMDGSEICIYGNASSSEINELLVKNDLIIESISAQIGDYEDYFIKLMEGDLR